MMDVLHDENYVFYQLPFHLYGKYIGRLFEYLDVWTQVTLDIRW